MSDPHRDWSPEDRSEAGRDPERRGDCDRYDRDYESSDRAYANWRRGGDFRDPKPDGRYS